MTGYRGGVRGQPCQGGEDGLGETQLLGDDLSLTTVNQFPPHLRHYSLVSPVITDPI